MDKEYYLTKEKHKELTEELEYLKNTKRKEIAENLEYAKSLGDLSENAEYNDARQNQAETEARIRVLEDMLKYATIVAHKKSDVVEIGSSVKVRRGRSRKKQEYMIVGSEESNMAEGKISYTAPLGKALLGAKKGDKVKINTPGGEVAYTVDKVE